MKTLSELHEALTTPSQALVDDLRATTGDIVVLGAAGKLGPSLVMLALRALAEAGSPATVHAVSRFGDPVVADELRAAGAHVITADVADDAALAALPDAENVIFLVGAKFGTQGNEHATWATNTYLPGKVATRYRSSRFVALSTGNVYPLVPTGSGGAGESDPVGPVGEYAMSCLGRERILTHIAREHDMPLALIRLNYAVEMRYGILVDLGRQILAGDPVDVTTGYVNIVWQGYANEVILRALRQASTPELVLNLTGPETLSVRRLAEKLGAALEREVTVAGEEAPTALLADAARCHDLFGYPGRSPDELVRDVAEWLLSGGAVLDKPTKFQVRDGRF
ncbi:NAD-dependent epimerase/dehydratase family protein [Jiangella gansuensis]|uniref:NAD-dependent epimerase/dehydratase family protein n=1 Tax=Jiangella gansuensis TaxID=281473 RepID=UPI00047CF149|nr:NAD(P)-dependent oxidoreductase [Jiangella gansuensis]